MSKKNKILLFSLLFIFIIFNSSSCFALEIQPKDYPKIPFTNPITESSKLPDYIVYFFALGIYIAGALAVISLAIGGIQLIFSSVSPEARNNAIDRIKNAILGLVLLMASVIIIQTINPALKQVQNTVALRPIGGLQLVGNKISTPAPRFAFSLDEIKKNYSAISWPATQKIINPATNQEETIPNCDPKTSGAYVVYFYNKKDLKDFWGAVKLMCGEETSSLSSAGSYEIIKEEPGVYFYDAPGCNPASGSDSSSVPQYSNKSIPEWTGTKPIKSILAVNGPDPKKGPFFGAVVFNDHDYKTNILPLVAYIYAETDLPAKKNYSKCFNASEVFNTSTDTFALGSIVIYQKADLKDNGETNINCSVTLYSKNGWLGGYYDISTQSEGPLPKSRRGWLKELKGLTVYYPFGIKIPKEEKDYCDNFYPNKSCLQSFEIKGNCLVVVASDKTTAAKAQAFPISPRLIQAYTNRPEGYSVERGTPQLDKDYITSENSYFMMVIPLSKKITE